MSAFLKVVNTTIHNAVNLKDHAFDYYSSTAGGSQQNEVCFGVKLCEPA
jgi:hypothetical protein